MFVRCVLCVALWAGPGRLCGLDHGANVLNGGPQPFGGSAYLGRRRAGLWRAAHLAGWFWVPFAVRQLPAGIRAELRRGSLGIERLSALLALGFETHGAHHIAFTS